MLPFNWFYEKFLFLYESNYWKKMLIMLYLAQHFQTKVPSLYPLKTSENLGPIFSEIALLI